MKSTLKMLANRLPPHTLHKLRRAYFEHSIQNGRFSADEPEYNILDQLVSPGSWVIDVGANVGHYTHKLSELVGPSGRVIALEPVAETFRILTSNSRLFAHNNVTLLNIAASDKSSLTGITVPSEGGQAIYYRAHLSLEETSSSVFCLPLDSLSLPVRIGLAKIDAEGHELSVLAGMQGILERDRPVLIVEDSSPRIAEILLPYGYRSRKLANSPNIVCQVH